MKPVEKMTYLELLEAQQRHKKILSNKSVLQKLPDKGKKLVETNLKIEERLQEYQTETEELSQMLSGMKLSPSPRVDVNKMEWTGKIDSDNSQPELKANSQQPSPTEDSTDIVDILLTTNQISKIVIDERVPATKADKSVDIQDPCYKRLTEKVQNLKPNHQFKPYKTLKHEQDPSSKQHHSWDENTAATPPQWKHNDGIKPIAIEESLQLQIQAEEKLKALELNRYLPKPRSLHATTIRPEELEEVYDEEPEGAGGEGESKQDAKGADPEANAIECDGDDICEVHDIPIPPDGGWGWVIVMSSFLCNLIVDGIAYTFGVFLPKFVVYFNEGKGTVAWVGSLLAGVYLSCGPIVGALTNKFGCRTTCIMGSVVGMAAFALSTLSESVAMLMVTYGIIGGIGFGLIYLPAIVSVGYYFEKKRALATGIAVCGSGFGTFVFAPLAAMLLEHYDWKGANLILAGIILNCAVFGSLMRPLEAPKKKCKPLLQRMAEDKAAQLERGSLMGSQYFMVQLADGSYEKRLKVPVNVDPGVHSSFDLDELAGAHAASRMPTISEAKSDPANGDAAQQEKKEDKQMKNAQLKDNLEEDPKESDKLIDEVKAAAVLRGSRNSVSNGEASNLKRRSDACGSKDDVSSLSASKKDLAAHPLARKDVLYTGSVTNLREYQSQKSLASYRQSIVSIPKAVQTGKAGQGQKSGGGCCTCIPEATRKEISGLMDFSLMKDPVFLFLGVSNVFGMLGFYVPFVYIIDAATTKDIDEETAAFLLSIIGITNTVGRLISGYISDFPAVDSLFVTNVCIAVSGVAVFCVPFCSDYIGFCIASGVFGLFSSAFIALTSIVLVDLLGIAQLTNAFGLLCLLRGVAAIVGPPLAGSVFDMTQSYDVPFWLAGIFLFISSAISFMVPCVRRWAKRKEDALKAKTGGEMKQLKSSEDATRAVQT